MSSYDPPQQPAAPVTDPAAGHAQPGYAQPGYAQPGYAQPGYEQSGYEQPGAQQPAGTEKRARWALPVAIVVSALPILVIPPLYVAMIVASIAQTQAAIDAIDDEFAASDEGTTGTDTDTGTDGGASTALPVELPFDVELSGAELFVEQTFDDAGWTITTKEGPSYLGYDNPADGCTVWYDYGPLDSTVDVSAGDRQASISLIEYLTGTAIDPTVVDDFQYTTDDWVEQGTADAVITGSVSDGVYSVMSTRAFTGLGQGVLVAVSCPDPAALESTLNEIPDLLSIALY
ncbi:hypothetical protein GE115_08960 [Agromyces sp. CFH 90414]|uniref:Uncharacterized protein n=1 Tax=Agromyces agglutinans TaxID=2662258 RepID=A0A6I2FC12_9MICO|nr:hypothetical protein [Agromyces agglutinans]MRG59996.1 hypothetical protein [Agromyces agglutinans]